MKLAVERTICVGLAAAVNSGLVVEVLETLLYPTATFTFVELFAFVPSKFGELAAQTVL